MTGELSTRASAKELPDIQGGLIGFNKDLQTLLYLSFPSAGVGRAFLAQIRPLLSPADEVLKFNALYKTAAQHGAPAHDLRSTWTNVWLTFDGLRTIEAPDVETMPEDFRAGMAQRASLLGDVGASDPSGWVAAFAGGVAPHCIVVVASDTAEDLEAAIADVQAAVSSTGVSPVGDPEAGQSLPGGKEHFGFKDGMSQPGILGLTTPSKEPHEHIAAGQFLIGYEDETGRVSGQPTTVSPPPPSGYDPSPPPPQPVPLPSWCRNGSFVVYRRLRQDVAGFQALSTQAAEATLSQPQLQAKLVGRWPSGAPMEHVPGMPHGKDPSAEDLSIEDPRALDDAHVNNFDYSQDADGLHVPRAAHIRKVNPRSASLPDGDASNRHRLIRRGIPYGPAFQPGEQPYGAIVPPDQDRGLLFACYQASITDEFEFVQRVWANSPNFQAQGDGEDPIISQDNDPRSFRLPAEQGQVDLGFAQWVRTTGGGYYFAPSMSAVEALSESSSV